MPGYDQSTLQRTRKDESAGQALRDAGFGNALMMAVLGSADLGAFGAALRLQQLQQILGIPEAAQLFGSNTRMQEMLKRGDGDAVGEGLDLWAALNGEEMPPLLRLRLIEMLGDWDQCPADPPDVEPEPVPPLGLKFEHVQAHEAYGRRAESNFSVPTVLVKSEAKVLADAERPLRVVPPVQVRPEQIYLMRSRHQHASMDDAWRPIRWIDGTVQQPNVELEVAPDSLFVEGAPRVEDIHQGRNGTCWLLASLAVVANQQPERIAQMIRVEAGVYTVVLHHFDGVCWLPVSLRLSGRVPTLGSGYSFSSDPLRGSRAICSEHWAEYFDDELRVWERRYFEMATWVPMFEKAFAIFSERYGEDGGASSRDGLRCEDNSGVASGYSLTNGGWPDLAARILFGEDVVEHSDQTDTDFMVTLEGSDGFGGAYPALIRMLARVSLGAQADLMQMVVVHNDKARAIAALPTIIDRCLQTDELKGKSPVSKNLSRLVRLVDAWQISQSEADERAVINAAVAVLRRWPQLEERGQAARAVVEQLCLIAEVSDTLDGEFLYMPHAYAVLDAALRYEDGQPADLGPPVTNEELACISPYTSEVTLFNPWGKGAPDLQGPQPEDDGRFVLTVDQLARLLPVVSHASVA